MYTVKHLYLLFFLFISVINVEAQDTEKVVKFGDRERIYEVAANKEYVGVRTYDKADHNYVAYLYDKNGNLLTKKKNPTNKFLVAEPVEIKDKAAFLIINEGNEAMVDSPETPDHIRLFDIETEKQVWETMAIASGYKISPDQKHLITSVHPVIERKGKFTIIDLSNGSSNVPDVINAYQTAAWLDNSRIVLTSQEYNKIEKGQSEIHSAIDEYARERLKLDRDLNEGKISQEEYEQKTLVLISKRDSLSAILKNARGKKNIWDPKATKFFIYNIQTNVIERENYIYTEDGKRVLIHAGSVDVDTEKNIYFKAKYLESDNKTLTNCFVKLDSSLNIKWLTVLGEKFIFNPIIAGERLYFRIQEDNENFLVDNETGQLKQQEILTEILDKHDKINLDNMQFSDVVKLHENFEFDKMEKTLRFVK